MLHILHSNRLELLRGALLQRLDAAAPQDPFAAEHIIVPSAALRRHLSLAIADARGICTNVRFDFLASWLWRQIARVVPGVGESSPFDAATLVWRVHAVFADPAFVGGHARLQAYLRDADALMRWELADQVAGLLEQYVTYRPDWLHAWSEGDNTMPPGEDSSWQATRTPEDAAWQAARTHEDAAWQAARTHEDAAWQAALWRRIAAELGMQARHPAQAFVEALQRGGPELAGRAGLPERVHVFALPDMAPLHMRLLHQLGQRIDVHLYVPNPCQEYWFDLIDRRRLGHLAARGRASGHEEEGNRLLAAWGRQAQVHIESLLELCGDDAVDDARFAPAAGMSPPGRPKGEYRRAQPEGAPVSPPDHPKGEYRRAQPEGTPVSLLAQLQNTLLELRAIAPGSMTLAEGDRSIELHVCHSLTRELEVLQDHLLDLSAADPALRPGDILVVTPDLDAAAPLIDAVFGTAPKDRALPYTLCGAGRGGLGAPARCLLALLALAGSRCGASEVFALLQQPLVARRFGLDDEALAQVHTWLREAGFHWALDAKQRAHFELPATPRHTLDDALQRLFLGYALPASCDQPFDGRLGAGAVEGSGAVALGALWRYAEALRRASDALQRPQPPEAWARLLSELLDQFLVPTNAELDDLRELRQTLRDLADDMHSGGVVMPLPLPVQRAALQQRLEQGASGGAAGGSINFASMRSLRGLPFAVVCVIGLNDGAFPGVRRPLEFDLMAQQPRRGDRQRRADDRGLMLDLLLAARCSLYLSHTGRSVRDNTPLPPSVLVAELLDLLLPAIAADPEDARALQRARQRLVVEHPLQPFALAAFDVAADPRLRSHDRELAEALRAAHGAPAPGGAGLGSGDPSDVGWDTTWIDADDDDTAAVPEPQAPFFAAPLPPPGPEWRQVALPRLIEFFRNPCRVLLRRRLGLELAFEAEELEDDEPLLPDRRTQQALSRRLLPLLLDGADPERLQSLALAGIELPDGTLGSAQLQRELQALQDFAARLRPALAEATLPPHTLTLDFELDGEAWQLQAGFADLRASGLLRWRNGAARATDYLEAWLQHLVLCAAAPAGVVPRTRWLGADGEFAFKPCADATARLHELLALYRRGLGAPLRFFARAAWQLLDAGLDAARRDWPATVYRPFAEGADPAYGLALRGVAQPLDAEFEALAIAVYAPLRAHLEDAAVQ